MKRILLIIDSYGLLGKWETLFNKLSFDVIGMRSDTSFSEKLLGFNPDLVIAVAKGSKVDGLKVATHIRKNSLKAKVILVVPGTNQLEGVPESTTIYDSIISESALPEELVMTISKTLGLDAQQLLRKLSSFESDESVLDDDIHVPKGESAESEDFEFEIENKKQSKSEIIFSQRTHEKDYSYKDALRKAQALPPVRFKKSDVDDVVKRLRQSEKVDTGLDKLKRTFVNALFKKTSS